MGSEANLAGVALHFCPAVLLEGTVGGGGIQKALLLTCFLGGQLNTLLQGSCFMTPIQGCPGVRQDADGGSSPRGPALCCW